MDRNKKHVEIDSGHYQWHACPHGCGMVPWNHQCPNDPDVSPYAGLGDDWNPDEDIDYYSSEAQQRGWHRNVFGGVGTRRK